MSLQIALKSAITRNTTGIILPHTAVDKGTIDRYRDVALLLTKHIVSK